MWTAWQAGWSLVSIAPPTSTGWLTMGVSSCLAGVSHLDLIQSVLTNITFFQQLDLQGARAVA